MIGVRYGAANDVWAVGASAYKLASSTSHELDFTLIEHWDGTHWYQVIGPNPSNHQVLFDAAIAGPNQVLAVGFSQDAEGGMAANTLAADLCEPTLRLRTWRTVNDFAIGPESWGLAEQKRFLGQLAKTDALDAEHIGDLAH